MCRGTLGGLLACCGTVSGLECTKHFLSVDYAQQLVNTILRSFLEEWTRVPACSTRGAGHLAGDVVVVS